MSYKNARLKLEKIGIDHPKDLISLIENQEITYNDLLNQCKEMKLQKFNKIEIFSELKEDLHGKHFTFKEAAAEGNLTNFD